MWGVLHVVPKEDANFASTAKELVQATSRNLIFVIGAIYAAVHFGVTISLASEQSWPIWPVSLVVAATFAVAIALMPRRPLVAQAIWQGGLIIAISVALYTVRQPEIAFLYTLLPFTAMVTVGWPAGLVAEALVILLLALGPLAIPAIGFLTIAQRSIITAVGAFTAALGWAASRTLYTITQWSIYAFTQARDNLEEARRHRAQLARVVKDLDQAYYRLERANAALVAAWKAADEAERFKAEFVAYVSHELRTPLNLIIGFSEMMVVSPESYGVPLPGPYRSDLDAIYRNAKHLLALVDDVLDLARIDVGRLTLTRDRVDLASLIGETTDMVKEYIAAKGLELQVRVPAGLPELWIDRLRVRQVLLNLLVNAARFTERGYVRVDVSVETDEVMVRVTDTGKGIAEEDLSKVFQEYHATEPSPHGWHGGTGLGLPISKKFVELHHGRMGVESTLGRGTCFWFTLPFRQPSAAASKTAGEARSRSLIGSEPAEKTVVVVHDDPRVAVLLQRYLDGYRLVHASNTAEGTSLAHEIRALALLTDLQQALASPVDSIPLIACPLPSLRQAAATLGAHDLLVKPVAREDLLAAIDRLARPLQSVLIADDDPEMVRLLRRFVRGRYKTIRCLEAFSGEEALSLIRTERPDLVLLDLVMPGLSGYEILRRMAGDPALASIAVIIISAKGYESLDLSLTGPIHVLRSRGFHLGEMVRIVEGALNGLAYSWIGDGAREQGCSGEPVGLQV